MAPHAELKKKTHSSQKKKGAWEENVESTHVKVRNGPSWVDGSSDHLENLVGSNSAAHTCKKKRREWRDDRAADKGYDVRPNRQGRFPMEHTSKTYNTQKKHVRREP